MKEFDYTLDYDTIDFSLPENRHLYRIGRGEQGVLLCEPYKTAICKHWRFKDVPTALKSSHTIYKMFCEYKGKNDFIGMDMARKFLEMGFTRARRYANHKTGTKYDGSKRVLPQETDALTSEKAKAAQVFKEMRDLAAYDSEYQVMRKQWRAAE